MGDESEKKDSTDDFIDPLAGMLSPAPEEVDASSHSDPSIQLLSENILTQPEDSFPTGEEVGEILDNALPSSFGEPEHSLSPVESVTEAAHPTHIFQVKVVGLEKSGASELFSSILKRLPSHPAFAIEEGHWQKRGIFRATRLNETAAYMLAKEAYRAGLGFHLSITDFDAATDDELGELGLGVNSEPETAKSSGAQAVEIPSNASEILLSTTALVAGYRAAKPKGIVTAHGSIPRILFREEEKNIRLHNQIEGLGKKGAPQPRKLPRAEIDKVMAQLLERLQKEAYRRGANGVVGVQIQAFPESNSLEPEADQIRIIASGTALLLVPEISE